MNDNDAVPAMNAALLDDLRRQNLALKLALSEVLETTSLLDRWLESPTLSTLRKKWANLIGEEL